MKQILLILLLFLNQKSFSQTITVELIPEKDNSIFSENGAESSGLGVNIFAGKTYQNTIRRGLLKFKTDTIPAGAIIISVKLSLAVLRSANNTTASHQFTFHKLLSNWGEGTSIGIGNGSPATANDATWTHNFYQVSNWITLGGDFEAISSATIAAAKDEIVEIEGNLKQDYMSWILYPSQNFGWLIKGQESTAGSAKGFGSKQNALFKPILTVVYSLPPSENVFINEVNPNQKWLEIFNPKYPAVDLSNYWISNGSQSIQLSNSTLLSGSLLVDSSKYVVLNWPSIGNLDGEITLFDGNPAVSTSKMKDYLQYGSANHQRANAAVIAQVWNNASIFLPSILLDSNSYSINGNLNFSSGKNTNSTSFLIQRETPYYKNLLCQSFIHTKNGIIANKYTSNEQIIIEGNATPSKKYLVKSQKSILILPNSNLPKTTIFEAQIGGCF